jgi:ribose/xylose/arabinose/galactoside ABC-type transport system permease subunit
VLVLASSRRHVEIRARTPANNPVLMSVAAPSQGGASIFGVISGAATASCGIVLVEAFKNAMQLWDLKPLK